MCGCTRSLFRSNRLPGKRLPTIIMAHGWGGVAASFRRDAIDFANAGYLVLTFDYRGWGESDARLVLTKASPIKPTSGQNQKFTAEVIEQREYVDPLEQTRDWFNVINWAAGEPVVDKDRIGLRGSSYSGGHVFYVAALDSRVKAVVSQVGAYDSRWVMSDKTQQDLTYAEGAKRAHGEAYPAPRAVTVGRLIGAPIRENLMLYAPIELAPKVVRMPQCSSLLPRKKNSSATMTMQSSLTIAWAARTRNTYQSPILPITESTVSSATPRSSLRLSGSINTSRSSPRTETI